MSNKNVKVGVLTPAQMREFVTTGKLPAGVKLEDANLETILGGTSAAPVEVTREMLQAEATGATPPVQTPPTVAPPLGNIGDLLAASDRAVALSRNAITPVDIREMQNIALLMIDKIAALTISGQGPSEEQVQGVLAIFKAGLEGTFRAGYGAAAADFLSGRIDLKGKVK